MLLKLCVIYLTLTCFILEPDRPLSLHLVFQPKYACVCAFAIRYVLHVTVHLHLAVNDSPPLRLHHQYLCRDVPQREAV